MIQLLILYHLREIKSKVFNYNFIFINLIHYLVINISNYVMKLVIKKLFLIYKIMIIFVLFILIWLLYYKKHSLILKHVIYHKDQHLINSQLKIIN